MSTTELPENELRFRYVRSSGPGGQNVNKVNSKAELRWRVVDSRWISVEHQLRFQQMFANRINALGELVLTSDEHRDQLRNAEACRARLRQMLRASAKAPVARKATKPSRAAKAKRLESKRLNSVVKRLRGKPSME